MNRVLNTFLVILVLGPCTAIAGESAEAVTGVDALQMVQKSRHRELLLDTRADWNRYTKFQLDTASVEFRKNWARDQWNRTDYQPTEEEMDRVKTQLSELLGQVLVKELTENADLALAEESGEDVIRITPHVVNLDIFAPDRMRDWIGYSLTDSAGHMTLLLEIHDSVSGALLAQASDYREDPRKGYMEWTTSGTNRMAARLLLQRWAKNVCQWLEDARQNS